MNTNKNFKQLSQSDNFNNTSFEDMPFLHDTPFYQEKEEKTYQQGDDFRPTFYNPFEIKHRRRTSRAQFKVLEKTFLENPKPNAAIRRWLAQKLVMTPRGVQVWFQNRRAKEKTVNSKKSPTEVHPTVIPNNAPSESTLELDRPTISEPLVKQSSTNSFDFMNQSPATMISSPVHSACTCNDCHLFGATPMTRTGSYPDEEELLMTPVTPFVDTSGLQQNAFYDYPVFMNKKFYDQDLNQQWPVMEQNKPNFTLLQQELVRRNMYNDAMFDESRRYSQPMVPTEDTFLQSNEVFRRLSEPIFDQGEMNFNYTQQPIFDAHFDLLPNRGTHRYM
ncbi:hypothetical protein MFLAVUS_001396 [Mucor flavus]|uniref:Homeobox domain-containing protein n=1 Tax=Mucor flavus TaxID=439312 RepID=A0ABP9YMC9_9FUNG